MGRLLISVEKERLCGQGLGYHELTCWVRAFAFIYMTDGSTLCEGAKVYKQVYDELKVNGSVVYL